MMKTKLIKTQREYRAALRRAEELMDARPGTPQGDELELLAALVEIYEERHAPVPPPVPHGAGESAAARPRSHPGQPQSGVGGAQSAATFDADDDPPTPLPLGDLCGCALR